MMSLIKALVFILLVCPLLSMSCYSLGQSALLRVQTMTRTYERFKMAYNSCIIGNPDITSCNVALGLIAMSVFGDPLAVNQKAYDSVQNWKVGQILDKIKELLNGNNLVVIQLSPNHYMSLFMTGENRVAMEQGYQGIFSLYDWVHGRPDYGVIALDMFLNNFLVLLDGYSRNVANRREGSINTLFHFNGIQEQKWLNLYDELLRQTTIVGQIWYKKLF